MLLEMACNVKNETIKERARHCFHKLIDILSRLDSKASDEIGSWKI